MINSLSWTPLNVKEGQQGNRLLNRRVKKKSLLPPGGGLRYTLNRLLKVGRLNLVILHLGCFVQRWPQPITSLHPSFSSSASSSFTPVNFVSSLTTTSRKPITSAYSSRQYLTELLHTKTPTHSLTSLWSSKGSVTPPPHPSSPLELTASVTEDTPVPSLQLNLPLLPFSPPSVLC